MSQQMTYTCSACGAKVIDTATECDACGHKGFRLDGSIPGQSFLVHAEHFAGMPGFHMGGATLTSRDDEGNVVDECQITIEAAGRALYLSRKGHYMQRIDLVPLMEAWAKEPGIPRPRRYT